MTVAASDRERTIARLRQTLRPGQRELAQWEGGPLAVAAVPGAGKSTGMAIGAAIAIARFDLHSQRQLVVVTFTRSAAASIKSKIRDYLQEFALPTGGFSTHTLHSLALHIASRHPERAGLDLSIVSIMTGAQKRRLLKNAVEQWLATRPATFESLLEGQAFDGEETEYLRRQSALRTDILPNLAQTAISEAKSSGLAPRDLYNLARQAPDSYRILEVAAGIYEQYESLRQSRDLIDYDDMIVSALQALGDPRVRELWQRQTFAVFEDEAQDSSPLQAQLLQILASDPNDLAAPPNLVRVGDPNQAINSTFTPADPHYFRQFCDDCQRRDRLAEMDRAGRSSTIILQAANALLHWANEQSGTDPAAWPFRPQAIRPVEPDDPQPQANPMFWGEGVEIYRPEDVFATVEAIGDRVRALFAADPTASLAILVREHRQGRFIAERLAQSHSDLPLYDASAGDRQLQIPTEIYQLLQFLDRPHSPVHLKAALEVLLRRGTIPAQDLSALAAMPEQFLYPGPLADPVKPAAEKARRFCRSLLQARLELPHYHLIAFLGLALKYSSTELATVQKLAARITQRSTFGSSLKTTLAELSEIVSSEKFEAIDTDTDNRLNRAGQLTIVTMHKAKGLEWDGVFVPFLHADDLPKKPWVPAGAKFLGDFTLAEVARTQIRTAAVCTELPELPTPTAAWATATRLKYAEEYRLLYVALTRAKRLLWLSAARHSPFLWNAFDPENPKLQEKQPTSALVALRQWLRDRTGA